MARGDIVVRILGDTRDLERKLGGAASKMGGFSSSIGSGAKKIGIGFAALTGSVLYGAKQALDAFGESQAVAAQTAAVIKSTGGAARVSAGDMAEYAKTLESVTAFDDETIQSSENLLATFTNVQNKVGAGNDIFTQATRTILDMSQALGQDTKASAIQLGKALNDPVKGITALRRVGVSFTTEQIKQIKALQTSGDVLGAQKIILGELTKEFGGSAEAFAKTGAGAFQQFKNTVQDAMEEVGAAIAPVAKSLLDALRPVIPILGSALQGLVKALAPVAGQLIGAFSKLVPAILPIVSILGGLLSSVLKALSPVIEPIVSLLEALAPTIKVVAGAFGDALAPVVKAVVQAMRSLLPILTPIIQGLGNELARVIFVVGNLLTKLEPIFGAMEGAILSILPVVLDVVDALISFAVQALEPIMKILGPVLIPIFRIVAQVLSTVLKAVRPLVAVLGDALVQILVSLSPLLLAVADLLVELLTALLPILPPVLSLITLLVKLVVAAIKPLVGILVRILIPVIKILSTVLTAVIGWVTRFVTSLNPLKAALHAVAGFFGALKDRALDAVRWIADRFEGFVNYFRKLPGRIASFAGHMWDGLKAGFKALINFFIDKWNALDFGFSIKIPKWVPHFGGKNFGIKDLFPDIPRLATGGIVSSPTLAMIGEGGRREAVVPLGSHILGGNTYSINISVPPTANLAEIGRVTVQAIQAYEKRSGSRWRAA